MIGVEFGDGFQHEVILKKDILYIEVQYNDILRVTLLYCLRTIVGKNIAVLRAKSLFV